MVIGQAKWFGASAKKRIKEMKNTKKVTAKSILVKPTASYTKDEVRSFLGLSKGTYLVPSQYAGMGGRGKVPGTAVIAFLENRQRGRTKIGRRYASGTVTVVAR